MLQIARLAPRMLGDATPRVEEFFRGQFNDDGGARDRGGRSDLYYTVFALEGLVALKADPPAHDVAGYLEGFGDGAGLDLVHLACLARCWATLRRRVPRELVSPLTQRLEDHRTAEGGYAPSSGGQASIYHSFLAVGALQDLGATILDQRALELCVQERRTLDGGYANLPDLETGSTPVTAAAITLLRQLDAPILPGVGSWLWQQASPAGGFLAAPGAPLPDLLSTATTLHALMGLKEDLTSVKERCLDFIDSLWTGHAFFGHWADDVADAEYSYYALLALGHLSF